MGLFSLLRRKKNSQSSVQPLDVSLLKLLMSPETLNPWPTLFGMPQAQSESDVSSMQFTATLRDLMVRRMTEEADGAYQRTLRETNLNMPHLRYSPSLRYDGLEWVCQWGSDESGIVARGDCPAKALINFDLAWHGLPPQK